ncbi:MAG: ATP-binding protein [Solirubrobacteraceae bacterium]
MWVDGDAIRLSQAIGNLLTNAIKFTGPEGVIAVALRSDGHAAQIQVRDDGRGFDRAHAAELFEPFAQGDTSLARTISGLGLGLPIVREIVGLHGGRVSAHSDGPGTGASFVIELPLFTEV